MKYIKVLLLLSIFLIFSSCREQRETKENPKEFVAYLDTIIQDWEGQDEFVEEFNRLTNSNLQIVQPPHQQYMDKLILSFSEISAPDVCEILPEYLSMFVTKGYVVPLNSFISESKYIRSFEPGFLNNYMDKNGQIFGFPIRDGAGCVTYIRKDWLNNLGLDIPTTWDEFYNVLYQFTYNDPDGNGIDDTTGYTDINSSSEDWYNRAIMHNARVEVYYNNGKWVDGFTEPQIIPALQRLKKVYQEGLIDPNITNNTTFTARNRFINGDVGIFTYWANQWTRNLNERTRAISGESAEIIAIPPIENGYYIKRVAPLLVITASADDPSYVFSQFIDNQYDKAQIQTLFTYGVKGYHWDIVNGKAEFLTNNNDPYVARYTKSFVPPMSVINNWKQPMAIDNSIEPALNILKEYSRQDKLKLGGANYSQYYLEISKELKPLIISQIINNEISIEEGLDLYRKKAKELHIEDILMELNN